VAIEKHAGEVYPRHNPAADGKEAFTEYCARVAAELRLEVGRVKTPKRFK